MRVLLVDDEKELVSTLAERLAIRNIDSDWVTDGEDALKLVETHCYDVAVLDIRLPGISGLDLQKKMRLECPGLKFIFMTGHGSQGDFQAGATEAGTDYYLVKPVGSDELIEKMNNLMSA
ncbi:MAG: response regulator [Deltaproteobacteria bacterium]|nr:response regulator [Deltaproteobacteria bacterium]